MKKEQYYKVYQAWGDMKYKCKNPKCKTYPKFGGSGISYSPEWEDYSKFREDMLPQFLELFEQGINPRKITLGRIDASKDFSASNCKWITPFEQTLVLNPQFVNFIVAIGPDEVKRVFPSLKDMANFYGVTRTGASNALHRGTNYIKDIRFSTISKEDYEKALEDSSFLNSLSVSYNREAFLKNYKRIRQNKAVV